MLQYQINRACVDNYWQNDNWLKIIVSSTACLTTTADRIKAVLGFLARTAKNPKTKQGYVMSTHERTSWHCAYKLIAHNNTRGKDVDGIEEGGQDRDVDQSDDLDLSR